MERETLEAEQRVIGPADKQTLRTMNDLGWTLHEEGKDAEAEKVERESMLTGQKAFGSESSLAIGARSNLAVIAFARRSMRRRRSCSGRIWKCTGKLYGADQPDTLQAMDNLANTLSREKKYADAEQLERETLEAERRVLGPEHPYTAETIDNLAYTLLQEKQYPEAEKMQRESLEIEKKTLGPEHPDTLLTMVNIAVTLNSEGRVEEGDKLARETLSIEQRVLGPAHPQTLNTMEYFAEEYTELHKYAEAEKAQREILAVDQKYLGAESPKALAEMQSIAFTLANEKRYEDAKRMLGGVREIQRRKLGRKSADGGDDVQHGVHCGAGGEEGGGAGVIAGGDGNGLGADVAARMRRIRIWRDCGGRCDLRLWWKREEEGKEVKRRDAGIFLRGTRILGRDWVRMCRAYGAGIWVGDDPGLRAGQDSCAAPQLERKRGRVRDGRREVGDEEGIRWPIWRLALL